jgi:biotin transport system substrate-specific component
MEAILKKEFITNKRLCRALGILTFVVLTSLGAFVRIPLPFTPVPITLQTFFVLLSGAFLGNNLGALSQISYIFLGVLGLPIFTGAGSGLSYLVGPTAGYILGFVLSNLFINRFKKACKQKIFLVFTLFCGADLIILFSGIIWLKFIFGYSLAKLFLIGFIPFIPGDFLKATLASLIYFRLRERIEEIF